MKPKILMVGGLRLAESLGTITRGLQHIGALVEYIPSRTVYHQAEVALHATPPPPVEKTGHQAVIETVSKALKETKYDLVFFWNPKGEYPPGLAFLAKKAGARTVYYTIDDPLALDNNNSPAPYECDVVLTCCQDSVRKYKALRIETYLAYPPVDIDYHYSDYRPELAVDISFCAGHCYVREEFPKILAERREMIEALKAAGTIALYGRWEDNGWGGKKGLPGMKEQYKGYIDYKSLRKIFASSKINLNSHVRPDGFMYLNMRTFECLGSGGFMLSDAVNGIENIFDLGIHLDVWRDLEELTDKTIFYLTHDDARYRMAMRGYAYVHQKFNNILFAEKILGLLA